MFGTVRRLSLSSFVSQPGDCHAMRACRHLSILHLAPANGVRALCAAAVLLASGCQMWPFRQKELTSIITPSMRAAAIREMGPRARDATDAEQARMCEQLAQQIRTEPDPIVRKSIQETIAEFKTPLASAVLLAGLHDDDRDVRVACCRMLGKRKDLLAIDALGKAIADDPELDVRLAAVDALGVMKDRAAMNALATALKDRDPAMQYAGVEAMKSVTGEKKLGNDVEAWRQYAEQHSGSAGAAAIASQPSAATTVK
jgi:HEAT repeat protein